MSLSKNMSFQEVCTACKQAARGSVKYQECSAAIKEMFVDGKALDDVDTLDKSNLIYLLKTFQMPEILREDVTLRLAELIGEEIAKAQSSAEIGVTIGDNESGINYLSTEQEKALKNLTHECQNRLRLGAATVKV